MAVERRILEYAVGQPATVVDVTKPDWISDYSKALEEDGRVMLSAPYVVRDLLASAIREATVTPIEGNGLRTYARITAVQQRHGFMYAHLSLAEELQ